MSDDNFGKYIAGGGVSGAVIAGLYLAYKCCYRRKIRSKCCGGEMSFENEAVMTVPVIPQPSPSLTASSTTARPPSMNLESKEPDGSSDVNYIV